MRSMSAYKWKHFLDQCEKLAPTTKRVQPLWNLKITLVELIVHGQWKQNNTPAEHHYRLNGSSDINWLFHLDYHAPVNQGQLLVFWGEWEVLTKLLQSWHLQKVATRITNGSSAGNMYVRSRAHAWVQRETRLKRDITNEHLSENKHPVTLWTFHHLPIFFSQKPLLLCCSWRAVAL